jgi:hypothetical protein
MDAETYTTKEAMDRLGVKGIHAFDQLERRYPEVFVIVKQDTSRHTRYHHTQYHKATLDRFAESREYFKQEKR